MNEKSLLDAVEASAQASSATGLILVHVVSLIARQPGFDRQLLLEQLEALQPPDSNQTTQEVYEAIKRQIVSNLKE